MKITILRHGQPDFEWQQWVRGTDFKSIECAYDDAGIVGTPPAEVTNLVNVHNIIVCSDLPRSIESAQALGAETIHVSLPVFREMNLPYFDQSAIKLPLKMWALILRSLWFVGFSKNTESFGEAKVRAREAAMLLVELATEHDNILFVGHGFLNHFVGKELLAMSWQGPGNPGKKYWEFGVYDYPLSD